MFLRATSLEHQRTQNDACARRAAGGPQPEPEYKWELCTQRSAVHRRRSTHDAPLHPPPHTHTHALNQLEDKDNSFSFFFISRTFEITTKRDVHLWSLLWKRKTFKPPDGNPDVLLHVCSWTGGNRSVWLKERKWYEWIFTTLPNFGWRYICSHSATRASARPDSQLIPRFRGQSSVLWFNFAHQTQKKMSKIWSDAVAIIFPLIWI